ncbi:predicted protein [Verticillium alfalfae VaMs.102]|uniref:Predicted protein n=1 Tax=Verticillium alfalfae (strain VaMs.102 / ATCC MYA-4576 / FGSC 10136) TaxID=526221 RepID=C9SLF8_VERA1|nr:predicted protein [Verticillium alfalfae VaMs.102]EEY19526.1 predicted protein [Verticillium alfalfae VaMs.102]
MASKPSKMLDANLGHGGRSRSPSASSDNGLPAYADTASTAQDDVIPPETLLLAGTTIHSTASITSPPLYELSLALGHLTPSHQKVELSRLDYHVRRAGVATAGDRGPEVAARQKASVQPVAADGGHAVQLPLLPRVRPAQ